MLQFCRFLFAVAISDNTKVRRALLWRTRSLASSGAWDCHAATGRSHFFMRAPTLRRPRACLRTPTHPALPSAPWLLRPDAGRSGTRGSGSPRWGRRTHAVSASYATRLAGEPGRIMPRRLGRLAKGSREGIPKHSQPVAPRGRPPWMELNQAGSRKRTKAGSRSRGDDANIAKARAVCYHVIVGAPCGAAWRET